MRHQQNHDKRAVVELEKDPNAKEACIRKQSFTPPAESVYLVETTAREGTHQKGQAFHTTIRLLRMIEEATWYSVQWEPNLHNIVLS
jgi:hypothetical protein